MKEIILITGNSGLLANETIKLLSKDYQIRTLTTNFSNVNNNTVFYWNIDKNFLDDAALKDCKHIVHLAGYSILKPWTKRNKKRMYNSRIGGSKLLFNKCQELNIKPDTFITASAMGIYGIYATGTKSENSTIAKDWVAQMAKDWEDAADNFKKLHTRVVKMRISLLLSKSFPLIKYNLLSIRLGIAPIIGSKKNIFNWIHLEDAARFVMEVIKNNDYKDAYNLATENHVTQYELIKKLKKRAFKYAITFQIPNFFIKFFLGQREAIINVKIKLDVKKLIQSGFKYQYNTIEEVLK